MKRIRTSELLITGGQKEITVTIVDEGAGPFLRIYTDADGFALDSERQDAIRLDFEEFNLVAEAVYHMEAEWADELAATLPRGEQLAGGSGGPAFHPGGAGGADPR